MTDDLTFKQLQQEMGRRLEELRKSVGLGLNEADTAAAAAERGLKVGARTIAAWEKGKGSAPSIEKLWRLLSYYKVSLGDFFRFTIAGEDATLVADVLHVIRNPKHRVILKGLISELRRMK